jgi:hypothetical protein
MLLAMNLILFMRMVDMLEKSEVIALADILYMIRKEIMQEEQNAIIILDAVPFMINTAIITGIPVDKNKPRRERRPKPPFSSVLRFF